MRFRFDNIRNFNNFRYPDWRLVEPVCLHCRVAKNYCVRSPNFINDNFTYVNANGEIIKEPNFPIREIDLLPHDLHMTSKKGIKLVNQIINSRIPDNVHPKCTFIGCEAQLIKELK